MFVNSSDYLLSDLVSIVCQFVRQLFVNVMCQLVVNLLVKCLSIGSPGVCQFVCPLFVLSCVDCVSDLVCHLLLNLVVKLVCELFVNLIVDLFANTFVSCLPVGF